MPTVRGCQLPDELLYDVENNIWYRENADGTVTLGMTAVAAAMAGQLVAFTAKKPGRAVQAGKSCATVESGKWVGPAKIAFDAEVVEVNDALIGTPKVANGDPLTARAGWSKCGQTTGPLQKRVSFPARRLPRHTKQK
jgi:glycine cleavage system H protein